MYTGLPPPRALAGAVDAFWHFEGGARPHRVLPDGCIDFLFDLEAGTCRTVGPMTRAEVFVPAERTRLFGVRFRPGAASAFLSVGAHELADREAPLVDVARRGARGLAERVAEAKTHAERRAEVTRFLLDPSARVRAVDPRVRRAAALLEAAHEDGRVRRIAADLKLSERQLERLFREHIGLRPKLFARIVRLQRAIDLSASCSIAQARWAAQAGYADEPHMLRDFRELAGTTPREIGAERRVGFVQAGRLASA